jgi:hypothetical protein
MDVKNQIKMVLLNALDALDRLPGMILVKPRRTALLVAVVATSGWLLWLVARARRSPVKQHRGEEENDDDASVAYGRAKFLARESARLVAQALEKRTSNPLEAYEHATHAAVLARTAKELDHDPARHLGDDLGVDFLEYLSYTSTVLQDVRSRLLAAHGR